MHAIITRALTQRLEAAEARCWWSAYDALSHLPGNPYGFELRRFGGLYVYSCQYYARDTWVNKILGAGAGDTGHVAEALAYHQSRGTRTNVEVNPGDHSRELLDLLHRNGFSPRMFCSVLYGTPKQEPSVLQEGVRVRLATTDEDAALVAQLHHEGMGDLEEDKPFFRDLARVLVSHPQWRLYIGEVNGQPAAQAWLHIAEGVGCMVAGATLPQYRGRGLQTALLHQRMADAAAAGCDLVCGQTDPVTVSQNNMERAGLRMAYTKVEFHPPV